MAREIYVCVRGFIKYQRKFKNAASGVLEVQRSLAVKAARCAFGSGPLSLIAFFLTEFLLKAVLKFLHTSLSLVDIPREISNMPSDVLF